LSKIIIEFKKGGSFEIILNDKDAPKTCKGFLKNIPYNASILQARYSGEEFFYKMPIEVGLENNVIPEVGDISFNADPRWQAVCIYYGSKLEVSSPFNLFGKIKGNLNELKKIGERVWTEGKEDITIKKI